MMFIIVFFIIGFQAYGQTCDNELVVPVGQRSLSVDELKDYQAKFNKKDELHLLFKQNTYSTLRKKKRASEGEAFLAKPALIRWNLRQPRDEYIYNGRDLYVHHVDQKLAMKFSAQGSQAKEFENIINVVLSFDSLLKNYDIIQAVADPSKKAMYLKLSPLKSSELTSAHIKSNQSTGEVSQVCLQYKDGKFVDYAFESLKIPTKFDPKLFAFDLPKGVKLEVFD